METTSPKTPALTPEQIRRAADYVELVWRRRTMRQRLVIGDLRVQEVIRGDVRAEHTVLWPGGEVYKTPADAKRFSAPIRAEKSSALSVEVRDELP
ncbi:hypothetical protein [Streptomyces sp. NPDC020141]|uniref:hypothetical protein n=1 Tax=Streptomyces sp. NPDC020141 TaxID=3365065 RepID=UPI0037A3B39F